MEEKYTKEERAKFWVDAISDIKNKQDDSFYKRFYEHDRLVQESLIEYTDISMAPRLKRSKLKMFLEKLMFWRKG